MRTRRSSLALFLLLLSAPAAAQKPSVEIAFVELRSYLLMYRCDPRYDADPQILGEVIDAVLAVGGGAPSRRERAVQ